MTKDEIVIIWFFQMFQKGQGILYINLILTLYEENHYPMFGRFFIQQLFGHLGHTFSWANQNLASQLRANQSKVRFVTHLITHVLF